MRLKNKTINLIILCSIFLFSIIVFFNTWSAMISIWIRSDTYMHGFIIIPASIWIIWQKKSTHPYLLPTKTSLLGLMFLILNGFLWLMGSIVNAQIIQQYSLVGILIGGIWFYIGNLGVKKIIFPLFFLYTMVPVGEAFIPYLMEYTADFTVNLLRLTGISVYRENMNFTLATGNWSVIEGCSGLRYLIASATLGIYYAYTTYTKTYKRIIFTLFSIVLPIIANGFRAYIIVMIGHLSSMRLAVGVDHVIYGAVFFALIIFTMFYIGSFWRDPEPEETNSYKINTKPYKYTLRNASFISCVLIVCISIWPLINKTIQLKYHAQTNIPKQSLFTIQNNWQEIKSPNWGWEPKFDEAVNESLKYFTNQEQTIGLYQVNFGDESQGKELVNTRHTLIRKEQNKQWINIKQTSVPLKIISTTVDFNVLINKKNNIYITALNWYQIGNYKTNNSYNAKLYQLLKRLSINTAPETYNIIFTKNKNSDNIHIIKRNEVLEYINNSIK